MLFAIVKACKPIIHHVKETIKRPQLPATTGRQDRTALPGMAGTEPVEVADYHDLSMPMPDLLSYLDREQAILIHGAKDTGKTTLLKHLMVRRPNCLILDPHGAPGKWPNCLMIGAGRDYEAIGEALAGLTNLMNARYREIGAGLVREGEHEKVTLLIDEYRGIVQNVSKSGKAITTLLTEARKVQIDMVLVSHSRLVKALGMAGEGDLREGFAVVHLREMQGRRTATLDVGQGEVPAQLPGPYVRENRTTWERPSPPTWLLQAVNSFNAPQQERPLFIAQEPIYDQEPEPASQPDPQITADVQCILAESQPAERFSSRNSVATFLTEGLDNDYAQARAVNALFALYREGHDWAGDRLGKYLAPMQALGQVGSIRELKRWLKDNQGG